MITSITGTVAGVHETQADLRVGPMTLSVLIAACDVGELESLVGRETTLYTLVYLEGDPNRGNLEPRMIGFIRKRDRAFFEKFTTVKGIGPKTALKALTEPIGRVASAIENKDARLLTQLKGIGKRTAELIVAELSGKVGEFATGPTGSGVSLAGSRPRDTLSDDAITALVALGERRIDAEALFEKARALHPDGKTDQLVREMLRLRGGR
jgi:holliday junction DNA helicase RuvA